MPPALIPLIPLIIGIVFGRGFEAFFATTIPIIILSLIALLSCVAAIWLNPKRIGKPILLLAITCVGSLITLIHLTSPIPDRLFNNSELLVFQCVIDYQPDREISTDQFYATGKLSDLNRSVKLLIRFRDEQEIPYGKQITVFGKLKKPKDRRNPGGFDYRFFLTQRGVFGILKVDREPLISESDKTVVKILITVEKIRDLISNRIDQLYDEIPTHAQVLKAMPLGQRHALSDQLRDQFQNSGTFHLIAVSGLHVGMIALFLFFFFSIFKIPRKIISAVTIIFVIFYAIIVGFRPSVLRATIMTILVLIAFIIDRDADLINILALTALIFLIIKPLTLWEIGFQLSFAATGSILYFLPKLESLIDRFTNVKIIKTIWIYYGVSISAQIATIPIIAYHFDRFLPIGFVSNFAIVWIVPILISTAILSLIFPFPIVHTTYLILLIFLKLIENFGRIPPPLIPPPRFGEILIYMIIILTIVNFEKFWENRKRLITIGLLIVCVSVWQFAVSSDPKLLRITFLDVGHGDAALIEFPDRKTILIDGGNSTDDFDNGESVILPFLRKKRITKIDLVVVSHLDSDHAGGLISVIDQIKIGEIIGISDRELGDEIHQKLKTISENRKIPFRFGNVGKLDLTKIAEIDFIFPSEVNFDDDDKNNDSIIIRLQFGKISILFTGDIEAIAESQIAREKLKVRSTIIKVPHHGSQTSSSWKFLKRVEPKIAVISAGFREPSRRVLERYQSFGSRILQTRELGAITLISDGEKIWREK